MAWVLMVPDQQLFLLWDDSFYYLEIGRNLAHGLGSTFDGLQPTNGYHPLWMAAVTGLFALGPPEPAVPGLALALQLLLWALVLTALLPPRERGLLPALALVLLGTHPFVLKAVANGMESTFVVSCHAALLLLALRHGRRLAERGAGGLRLVTGLLLALAFLSRTDGGLLAASCIAWITWQARRHGPAQATRTFLELGFLPLLALVLFLASNQLLFGHPMQVSGELKRVAPAGLRLLPALLGPLLALGLLLRRPGVPGGPLAERLAAAPWYPAFLALHLAYYLGLQTYPRLWYFAPELLYLLFLAPGAVAALQARARSDAQPGRQERAALLAVAPLLAVLGLGWLLGVGQALDPGFLPPRLADRDAARWADAHLPPDAVLGSWDAGLVGWTSTHPVVNLDGVVASHAYLQAMRQGTTAAYLAELGVTHIVNHHDAVPAQDASALLESIALFFGPQAATGATLLYRRPYEMTGNTNDKGQGTWPMATSVLALPAP